MLCFRLFLESKRHVCFVLDRVGPHNVAYLVDEQSVVLGSSILPVLFSGIPARSKDHF